MDFNTALTILWGRRSAIGWVVAIGVIVGAAAFLLLPRQFQATSSVLIVNAAVGRDPSMSNTDMPVLLESSTVLRRVSRDVGLDMTPADMQRHMSASIDLSSNVMPISFRHRDPYLAVKAANALADELSRFYRQASASRFDALTSYLNRELIAHQRELDAIDRKLQLAIAKDPYVGSADATTSIGTQIVQLDQQRAQLAATMMGHAALADMASSRLGEIDPIVRHELLQNDPTYQGLASQLAKDATQLDLARAQFTAGYPGLPGLADQVRSETSSLDLEARRVASRPAAGLAEKGQADAIVAGDRAQLAAVDNQIAQAETHLNQMPTTGVEIATLRRQRDAAETAYQALAQQRTVSLAAQAEAASVGSVVVLDRAVDAQSVLAKNAVLLAFGAALGFIVLGLTLPFVLEMTDVRLRSIGSIEGLYGRPVIATIIAR